ncbi:bifunctional 4-hydroxy-2-oxoglutarate aldolase/2-dehydro-3-deoxy-phosphogluconate aldolase [Compostibacter hankyongensis]|uniref:Bifunctional 4-hydroxy-2-oxoglutarate aldolase/2-dehydro-3-deoxy-phosphogluconate aldolase n=1 Tax=Compostibacter hankyongensis TaxID=1007089 RepID=A0ABP8FUL1_9BACT
MDKKTAIFQLIPEQGVLPLYFHKDPEVSIAVLKALHAAGIRAVEYTNRGEAALKNFKEMRRFCDAELKDFYLGIGTIKSEAAARTFIDAGADFIVCPGLVEGVVKAADEADMLWVPGCMTPSEIIAAEELGAKMIKLFPGNLLGPSFVSAIKPLFPNLLFMPTGGVDVSESNLSGWFKAGVCAVGMGSKLISKPLLEQGAYGEITDLTVKTLQIIQSIQKT